MNVVIRALRESDLVVGYYETLQSLDPTAKLEPERAQAIFTQVRDNPVYCHLVAVPNERIVGAATLLIEQKFTHGGRKAGHIEDVATHREFQRQGIGQTLIQAAIDQARRQECYKVVLDCSEQNVAFYEKCGFSRHGVHMRLALD